MKVNTLTEDLNVIPNFNCVFHYYTGDGFKTLLPFLLKNSDLVVTHKQMLSRYENTKAIVTNLYSLNEIQGYFDRVILDCNIPTISSALFKNLQSVCKDKVIIIVQAPFDRVREVKKLIEVSKEPLLSTATLNQEWLRCELLKLYTSGKLQ